MLRQTNKLPSLSYLDKRKSWLCLFMFKLHVVVGKRKTIPTGWAERPVYSVLAAFGLAKEEIAWLFQLLCKY